ncbi:restriction endonuclease subunit S [Vagococcus fluvialis]|uniref:restriction endonuclease subunit S n=1 Tax=Vagococcus fluvialis TaxID=2738 RepID=UPI0028F729EE|nr:restriction endonuclease subunit S [Vagococcus fluvialis]WNF91671.1 restriction endonuclease subunit S [Vagococcus fluvialis]
MTNRNEPMIRFKNFMGTWKQHKLGDTSTITAGGDVDKKKLLTTGKYPVLANALTNNGVIGYYQNDFKVEGPAVTVTGRGDIGHAKARYFNFTPVVRLLTIKSDHNSIFLENLINNYKVVVESTGVPQLTSPQLGSYRLFFPTLEEQNKIGNLFELLDNIITLQERKLILLKEQKKGFLQKMFPKTGEKLPELRFKGFIDPWEQRKLSDISQITMGQSPNGENYTENPDDHILVQGNADMKNGRVVPRVWTTQITKTAEQNDIILSVRAPVGDVGKTDYNVVLGRGVAGIRGNDFIYQSLIKMKDTGYWTRFSTGSTFESINSTDLKEAILSVPSEGEQQKIGTFFKYLDDTVALQERKLELLKEQKKAFLQKMFV